MTILAGALKIGSLLADIGGIFGGMSSAERANRTNIKLQREQQAWEKEMSNTAVQRRAADIEMAGGNRALAFTNGQEASTPSVAPAQVQPTFKGDTNFTAKAIAMEQIALQKQSTAASVNQANTAAQLNTALAGKANAEAVNIAAETANKGLTGKKLQEEITNLQASKREIEARAALLMSQEKVARLEAEIKSATKKDLIRMATSQADAAKYGVTFKQWQDMMYGALTRIFGNEDKRGTATQGAARPPIQKNSPSQKRGTIRR